MAISVVGSIANATASATVAVNPTAIGDVLVLQVGNFSSFTVSSVSGGGVTTWIRLAHSANGNETSEFWWGVVTSTGPSTITIVNSGASYTTSGLGSLQFHGGATGTWGSDGSNTATGSGLNGNYPSLTPTGTGELYLAGATFAGGTPGGSTAGFTYINGYGGTDTLSMAFVYNTSASTPTAQSPAWSSGSGADATVSGLLTFTPSLYIPNSKISRQAVSRASVM